jgi:hypothetical protein
LAGFIAFIAMKPFPEECDARGQPEGIPSPWSHQASGGFLAVPIPP